MMTYQHGRYVGTQQYCAIIACISVRFAGGQVSFGGVVRES